MDLNAGLTLQPCIIFCCHKSDFLL